MAETHRFLGLFPESDVAHRRFRSCRPYLTAGSRMPSTASASGFCAYVNVMHLRVGQMIRTPTWWLFQIGGV